MSVPHLRVEETGERFVLQASVTTIGRGAGVDVALGDASVSRLHAEIVRRGPHVYVSDLGLSANGTRVNGRPVACHVLLEGDTVAFGLVRTRICGLGVVFGSDDTVLVRRISVPALTRRELDVLTALCRPALHQDTFASPSTTGEIARELVVTDAAVKQHLLRLYTKFRIPEGANRRAQLANEALNAGVIHPLPVDHDSSAPAG